MPILKIYLTFDDAYSAMKYYEEVFGTVITNHIPVTKEIKEQFKLEVEVTPYSTFDGEFIIQGIKFGCSDKFDNTTDLNNSLNPVLEYKKEEISLFEEIITKVKASVGVINYEQLEDLKFHVLGLEKKKRVPMHFDLHDSTRGGYYTSSGPYDNH